MKKRIPQHKISFKDIHGICTEQEKIIRELSARQLYGKEFAYCAFSPKKKKTLLETGSPHSNSKHPNDIDCCIVDCPQSTGKEKEEIRDNREYDLVHYIDMTATGPKGMFAIYNKSKLAEIAGHPYYEFKEPNNKLEALLAIVEVSW